MDEKYSWVETHKEIAQYLKNKEHSQLELIDLLKSVGITGFSDKSKEGDIELSEIDPFTFFCYIHKHGSKRALELLQQIAEQLNLEKPATVNGIPSAQPLRVWLFPPEYLRVNNEVPRLWSFFKKELKGQITDEDFADVLEIKNVGRTKLTEVLFYINPEKYLPINGPTIPYIEKVLGINPVFETYSEYLKLLEKIRDKTDMPFYELSHEAWVWKKTNVEPPENDPIQSIIEDYKKLIAETRLMNEVYKWELIDQYKGRPNLNVEDLHQEVKSIDYKNLIYHLSKAVMNELSEEHTEEIRKLFSELFDESIDLTKRVKDFSNNTKLLYKGLGKTDSHHQDERAVSAYLTYRNPKKYTFYKHAFYKNYCQLLKIKQAKKNEKYTHYLSLIDELIEKYIAPDSELIEQVKSYIPQYYDGTNHKLLAQDILYQMLDRNTKPGYWIFQGNPDKYDFETAFKEDDIAAWTVTSHKNSIKPGDKVIIWITGSEAGCYALAEVVSKPLDRASFPESHYWKEDDESELKVAIDITHNLANYPILKEDIDEIEDLANLKVGNQGTNFSATEKEYNAIVELIMKRGEEKRYWLYSPGEQARNWDEFYNEGIMGLGWDKLDDLTLYKNKDEIKKALNDIYGGEGSQRNNSTANDEFANVMQIGDVVIVKKGLTELLGYGVVTSEYIYDENRDEYKHIRKVDWKLRGNWIVDGDPMVPKTLTDITPYPTTDPKYNTYYERLLGIMGVRKGEGIYKMNYPLNTIFYGPPGTGKTYNTVLRAAEIVENKKIKNYEEALDIFNVHLHNQIEFITFHQNYSYEDFIQGIRPDTDNNEELTFEKRDGVFKKIADRALKNLKESEKPTVYKKTFEEAFNQLLLPLTEGEVEEIEVKMKRVSYYITAVTDKSIDFRKASGGTAHTMSIATLGRMYEAESVLDILGLTSYYAPLLDELLRIGKDASATKKISKKKNYVIIIDEINRANISRVFGELITLIEPDKRSHGEIPMQVKLPSGDKFIVPSNLYIIGTMNTADKSIALLDIALRRRFEFEAMYPLYKIEGKEIYDVDILEMLNKKIVETKGYDFQIGHSFFMDSKEDTYELTKRMNNKVIPLLLEYYMNDDKEVRGILQSAGLTLDEEPWPLRITGKKE